MASQVIKRKYPRRKYYRPVGILFQGQFWIGKGEEIGEGGLLVLSPRPIPDKGMIIVTVLVPYGDIAIVRSELRYALKTDNPQPIRLGIQFVNISFKHKKKIRDYISAKSEAEAV